MSWNRYGRGNGWDKLGEAIAMMAMSGNMNFGGTAFDKGGAKARWRDDREGADDFSGEDSESRRRGRRGRMFGTGELRLALLALISDAPRHGYELIKEIEEATNGSYAPSPGAVYPTLQMLADEGKIEEAEAEGAKKPFKLTAAGEAELDERKDEVTELMGRLALHGHRANKVRSHDVFRAMGNLASVLKNRARAGKLDEGTINEIVDMIDEMAKRIERL
ncbi:PadR family transcriptional regulator [Porphyrobacter sp. AAP60]|uniref:PadR family transcriptional regulator n=1 Tax=Porphyrobacter sp. AAP60 TaxID=1523423 RepID=UPI0006BA0013|nr:PadR family transcriptional regulator [Porphyrobacter sp. AAP60]KPF61894.1 transcriptional regulator [Porphyrobacter sp. AAP60]